MRLRCLSSACELRSPAEQQALKEKLQKLKEGGLHEEHLAQEDEIAPDDREDQDVNCFDEDDDEEDLGNQDDALSKRDLIRELWPHACPEKFWSGLFEALHLSTCSLVCIFTTSAHPGAMLAARAKGLQVHVLQDRVNPHCQGHGKQLADSAFRKLVKVQTQGIKRKLLVSDLDSVIIEGQGLGFLYLVKCS